MLLRRTSGRVRSAEGEADVASRHDLVAFLAVLRGAPRVHDEGALLLAGQVRVDAHHPGVDLGEEHAASAVVHVLGPGGLRLRGGLHLDVTSLAHVPEERGDPIHILLDAARDVAESRGVMGTHEGEQVGEALDLQTEIGARTLRPLLPQAPAAAAADFHAIEGPRDGVEAGGVDDHVELVLGVGRRDARDRKSTRLNSSHLGISYAVFCLKKKKHKNKQHRNNHTKSPPLKDQPELESQSSGTQEHIYEEKHAENKPWTRQR